MSPQQDPCEESVVVTATFLFMPSDFAAGGIIRASGEASFAGSLKPIKLIAQVRVAASYLGLGVLTREVMLDTADDLRAFAIIGLSSEAGAAMAPGTCLSLAKYSESSPRDELIWSVFEKRIRVDLRIDGAGLLTSLARRVDLPPGYTALPRLGSGDVELTFYCERLRPQNKETA